MNKLYDVYLEKKKENAEKIYLFRNGNFYIALGDDAIKLSEELELELTKFSKETVKCGFPVSKFKRYTKFIKLLGYDYEIVLSSKDQIVEDIFNIDLDTLTLKEAFEKIKLYKEILNEE